MTKRFFAFAVVALLAAPAMATENTTTSIGLDFSLPYTLTVDGNTARNRANFNIGVDGRYMMNENWNLGARFAFDVEKQTGTARQISFIPGVQYHFMPEETWNPYIRADLPVLLSGAAHATSTSKQDVGIGAGFGLAWNIGEAIGVQNMAVRYDFNFFYTFGMGSTLPVFGLEIMKIGFDYKF